MRRSISLKTMDSSTRSRLRRSAAAALIAAGISLPLLPGQAALASDSEEIGCISTTFRLASPNDKICVTAYTDPLVPAVTCYLSQARTGGYKGAVGLAQDPSRFALACTASQPISLPADLPDSADVFSERTSLIFKKTTVRRMVDRKQGALIYLGYSTKIVDGSPMNAISVVPFAKP
jgi:CreA protein